MPRVTRERAIAMLNAIDESDPEKAHSQADEILLARGEIIYVYDISGRRIGRLAPIDTIGTTDPLYTVVPA